VATEAEKLREEFRKAGAKAKAEASKPGAANKAKADAEKLKAEFRKAAEKAPGGGFGESIPGVDTAKKVGGGLLGGVIRTLGVPQQAVFRIGSGVGELATGNVGDAVGEFGKALQTPGQIIGKGPEHIGFAEATTPVDVREQGGVRKLPTGVETLANIGLDPLLPTAFSKAAKAKGALKAAEGAVGAKTGAKLAEEGIGALSQAERASLRAGLEGKAAEVGATGGRRSLTEIAQGVKAPSKMTLEEGAERTAAKNIKYLESADAAKPATAVGRVAERLPAAAAEKLHVAQGVTALKNTDFAKWAADAVVPRAGIIRDYSKKVADNVKALGGERLANVARQSGEVSTGLQARIQRLGREVNAEDNKLLAAALRGEQWAIDTAKASDLKEIFEFAADLEKKSGDSFAILKPAKAAAEAPRTKLAAVAAKPVEGESYARAKLREILARRGQTPEELGLAGEGAAKPAATAAKPAGAGNLDELTKTPISDATPLQDVLNRNFQSIHGTETKNYLAKMQAELKDPQSGEQLVRVLGEDEKVPAGWVQLKSSFFGNAHAPESIAKEIDRVGALLDSDDAVKAFDGFLNKYDRLWKSAATSIPVGIGFTARNARSNLFLNWLDGLHTVGPYKEALGIQRKAASVIKSGKFADDITARGLNAVMKEQMTARQYRVWDQAMKNRVLGSNYFDIDLAFSGLSKADKLKGVETGENVVQKLGGKIASSGKGMNSAVEDHAKLAIFIHNLDRFGDAKVATEHVHKFLFDYADLTAFEQRRVRKFIPFYTFMRKNVPLQVEQTFLQPGKISLRLQAGEAAREPLPEGAPSYLEREGAGVIPGAIAQTVLGAAGQVALTPDNPLTAAAKTLEPFSNLAGAVPAILRGDAPESLPAEVWRPLIANMGGGRGAPLKALFEEGTQTSAFTGGELPPGDVRGRLARALIPLVPRFQGAQPKDQEAIRQFLIRQAGLKLRDVE
jgi:hypothetical protein